MVTAIVATTAKEREKVDKYLRKAKSVGTKGYGFMDDPEDARKVLFRYDKMFRYLSAPSSISFLRWNMMKMSIRSAIDHQRTEHANVSQ